MKITRKANQSYSIKTRYREIDVEKAKVQPGRGKDGILGTATITWSLRQGPDSTVSPCTFGSRDAESCEEYTFRREDGEIVCDQSGYCRKYLYKKDRWEENGEVEEWGDEGIQTGLIGWGGVRAWLMAQDCPGSN